MISLSARNLTWGIVALFLPFAAMSAVAGEEEQEMRYLFAGMLQERGKLKSWSCKIEGMDPENLSFDMNLLSNGESVRFNRTQHLPAFDGEADRGVNEKGIPIKTGKVIHLPKRDQVVHACDNMQMTVAWNESSKKCNIFKSDPLQRQSLHVWDPRMSCLILDDDEIDYRKALNSRLEFWRVAVKIEHKGALRTVTFTKQYEWRVGRLSLTIDTEHGFTPVLYRGDILYKPNSKFPGKVEVEYEATAKWKQLDGVWVPVHHRHVKGDGTVVREYKLSWNWINKKVDDKEFTIDALGVPNDVPKSYFDEKGDEIRKNSIPATADRPVRQHRHTWIRWLGYLSVFLLFAIALYRLRKRPNNPAG